MCNIGKCVLFVTFGTKIYTADSIRNAGLLVGYIDIQGKFTSIDLSNTFIRMQLTARGFSINHYDPYSVFKYRFLFSWFIYSL